MGIESVEIEVAQQRSIRRRLRDGEKVSCIAKEIGLPRAQVTKIARVAGIKLKKGRRKICDNPELYSRHIDARLETGTAAGLMSLFRHLTLEEIGQALGGMSRGSVHHIMRGLTGHAPKPVVPHKPVKWQRVDITVGRVRESAGRCLSVAAMARELGVSESVIYRRARSGNIVLPKGHPHLVTAIDQRPDITHERMQISAETLPSISAMARELKTTHVTVKRRAKRFGISLPRYGKARLAP